MSTINPDVTKLCYSVTVSSGSGSQALPTGMANKVIQLIIIPPSEVATYTFYIEESLDNMTIFRRDETITGTYNELLVPALPLFGNNTINISGASVDGTYKVRVIHE